MRVGKFFIAVAALSGALCVSVMDGADAAQGTTCILKVDSVVFDPGLSSERRPNTFYSPVDGTIECDGPVHGKQPTGPGIWIGNSGHLDGSCAGGKGTFAHSYRMPTEDGELRFGAAGTFTFGVEGGGVAGGFDSDEGSGTFSSVPKKGDCVTAPLTEVAAEAKMTVKH